MPGTTRGNQGLAVLEDPTGRRARWMRRAGRVVFVVFMAWLLAIVLAGLGLIPGSGIPLTHALRPSTGPPPLATPPRTRQPPVADLRPALTAAQADAILGPVAAPVSDTTPGKSGSAPGQTKTTPTTTGTTTPGRSGAAPGHTKTAPTGTTTAPGKSGSAPGRTTKRKTKTTPAPGKKK